MLDNNILIYKIKQKPVSVINKFKKYKLDNIAISSIVYAEMMYVVYDSQNIAKNLKALHALIDNF